MKFLKRNFHWIIAALIFIEMIFYGGFLNCISIFTVDISEALNISRSSYSISQISRNIVGFVSTLMTGLIYHKFGYRKSSVFFLILSGIAMIMLGMSQSLTMVCISYGMIGLSAGVLGTAGAVRIVKNWFHKHQGTILGMVTMATGIGGSLLATTLTEVTTAYDWRIAQFVTAGIFIVVGLLFLILRDEPSEMGLKPYGEGQISSKKQTADPSHTEWAGHTFKELLKTPQFYLMALCIFLSCLSVYAAFNVIVPHFKDNGYNAADAANYHSIMMLTLSIAKLLGGWLSDRIGAKRVAILTVVMALIGHCLLIDVSNPILSYVGVILLSFGLLVASITAPLLTMPLFGYRAFGTITGIFMAMISLGNMLATPLANLCYDMLGSYTPAFQLAAILDVIIIGLFLLLFFLCDREKKRFLAAEAA